MKWIHSTLVTSLLAVAAPFAAAWCATSTAACGRESESGAGGGTGGASGAGGGGAGGAGGGEVGGSFATDAPSIQCKLDDGSDPVSFCIQKLVLQSQHEAGLIKAMGMVQSWDSTTFAVDKDPNGMPLHDPRDDAAYAASAARYHTRSATYGDNELTPTLDADLAIMAPILEQELTPPLDDYSGDLYFDLRTAAGGLRVLNYNDDATKVDALAEAYGAAIFDLHFITVAGADAGADGGAAIGVLGMSAGSGAVDYRPDAVATGALALLDLAVRHASDAPMKAVSYQNAAAASLDYLMSRARDATTGLYFTELTNSSDPDHDALVPSPLGSDTLQSDVVGTMAFALFRAQDLVNKNGAALAVVTSFSFEQMADDAIAGLNGPIATLWDKKSGGYSFGFSIGKASVIPGKTTRANAMLLASLNRARALTGTPYELQITPLQSVVTQLGPMNTSLLSVVVGQNDYLRQATSAFQVGADDAGPGFDSRANSYFSSAISIAVEALDDQTYGLPTN